jgi:hypothetical protein
MNPNPTTTRKTKTEVGHHDTFAAALRGELKRRNIPRKWLAAELNVNHSYVSQILSPAGTARNESTMRRMANALGKRLVIQFADL